MSKQILVSVVAAGCLSRFRNGTQFTKTPKEIKVDESELAILQADNCLNVNVLSDDANNDANNESGALDVDADVAANTGTDTVQGDDTDTNAAESADVSKEPDERLAVITEAMRDLNLDMTADKPTVNQLKEQGLDVSAKERDVAWDMLVKEHAESQS